MKVFWFDTETSGLDPRRHGILQLAYIYEQEGEILEKDVLYANCHTKEISDRALEIAGFTREQIATWPAPKAMYEALHKLFKKYVDPFDKNDKMIAAGYNVAFDVDFLRQLWFENGDKYFGSFFAFGTIDVAQAFRYSQWMGLDDERIVKATLSDVADYYGIPFKAHDALADIQVTRDIALQIQKNWSPV